MNDKFNIISGCAGIGGLDLGFKETGRFRTVCYIEREPFPQAVLLERMQQRLLDPAPIWSDFTTFDGKPWRGAVDGFIAGIPCQPHSMAGKRRGAGDDRNLWPHMQRIIREMGPSFVLVENVPGLFVNSKGSLIDPSCKPPTIRYIEWDAVAFGLQIMGELQHMGYCVCSFTLSARETGAWHKRNRRFIFGVRMQKQSQCSNSNSKRLDRSEEQQQGEAELFDEQKRISERLGENVPDTMCQRCGRRYSVECKQESKNGSKSQGRDNDSKELSNTKCNRCDKVCDQWQHSKMQESCRNGEAWGIGSDYWKAEPGLGRVVDGVSDWVDRIKGLGNAVVPQVAYKVAQKILQIIEADKNDN